MSKIYVAKQGDTLEKIAAKTIGSGSLYQKIWYANPFIINKDIIPEGQKIIIPDLNLLNSIPEQSANDKDKLTVNIDGVLLTNFFNVKILLSIDAAADSFILSVPFDPNDKELKELFKPFNFNNITIFIGNELILNGFVVNIIPSVTDSSSAIIIEGYSKTGILNDCHFPPSSYPLEFNNLTLFDIVSQTASYFNINAIDEAKDDYTFLDLDVKPETQAYDFISGLAKKRGVLLKSNNNGELILKKSSLLDGSFTLEENSPGILNISTNYDGQKAFTTVTGILNYNDDDDEPVANSTTEKDQFLIDSGVSRPFVYQLDNIEDGTITQSVKSKLRRGWGERISYRMTVSGWRTPTGELWRDDLVFNLYYPSVMIYKTTKVIVKTSELIIDHENNNFTELEVTLPQAYNDEPLETLPWLN